MSESPYRDAAACGYACAGDDDNSLGTSQDICDYLKFSHVVWANIRGRHDRYSRRLTFGQRNRGAIDEESSKVRGWKSDISVEITQAIRKLKFSAAKSSSSGADAEICGTHMRVLRLNPY